MKPGDVFRVGLCVYEYESDHRVHESWFRECAQWYAARSRMIASCTTEEAAEAALRLNRLPDGPKETKETT